MADVPTPPAPPSPRAAAKGLGGVFKGKPAWVWIAGVTVLIGVAYLAMRGNQPAATVDDSTGVDEGATLGDMANGDYGGYYPVATEGAYGGSDIPFDYGPISDNAGTPEPSPVTNNITVLAPPTSAVTGGGKPAATGAGTHAPAKKKKTWKGPDGRAHDLAWWQNPVHNRKRIRGQYKWRWPGGGGFVHSRHFNGGGG